MILSGGRTRVGRRPASGVSGRAVAALLALAALGAAAGPSRAQMMHLDPLPFFTPADSTSRLALVVDVEHTRDDRWDWTTDRILLTAVLPAGDDATFFLRMPHVTFDTGDVPVWSRWPWIMGPGAEGGWPGESRLSGFGKLTVGVTGPVVLPLFRGVDYGLAIGLPLGSDRLYPVSSESLPFRVELRKPLALPGGLQGGLSAGTLMNMDSGRDYFDPEAFPNGYRLGASLARYGRPGSSWRLTWDYRNERSRESHLVGLHVTVPWTADGTVGLKFERELAGTLDRYAAWRVGVTWRLDSPAHRPGRETPPAVD